jgi:DNA-binding MarR family transcriptional regulator
MALRFLSPIHKAHRQISELLEKRCSDLGITAAEGQLLSYLRSYSPAPVSEFRRVLGVRRSTLTSMLDRLQARKWLVRQPSPRDRRVILVGLTETGRDVAGRIRAAMEQLEAEIGGRIGPNDLKGFGAVLSAIDSASEAAAASSTLGPDTVKEHKETA